MFKGWDDLDQLKALEWMRREADTCPNGHHLDVTDLERGGDPEALRLASRLCPQCEIAERNAERYAKEREPGEYQVWVPNERQEESP